MVERNTCDAVMRGIVVPPGSRATSRANGSRWNLGYLGSGRPLFALAELICDQSYTWDGVPADLNFMQVAVFSTKTGDPAPAERRAGARSTIFSARRWTPAHGAWP
jgi:hypothetical protein